MGGAVLLLFLYAMAVTGFSAWRRSIHVFADRTDVGLSVLIILASACWAMEPGWGKGLLATFWVILLVVSFLYAVQANHALGRAILVMPAKLVYAGMLVILGTMALARIGSASDAAKEGRIGKAISDAGVAVLLGTLLAGMCAFTVRLMPTHRSP